MHQSFKISNEDKIILLCARTPDTQVKEDILKLLHGDVDWNYLIQRASQHRLTQLLYWNLKDFPEVPEKVLNDLKRSFEENAQRNLLMLGELLKILKICESQDITVLPYKGPILAEYAYGNIALRLFDDIDIFVYKDDVLRVKEILLSQGYRPQLEIEGFMQRKFLKSQREYKFFNSDKNVSIEIHWQFFGLSFSLSGDSRFLYMRENFETLEICNQKVLSLKPENMFIVLCIHASGHRWPRLSWICDLYMLVQFHEMDWEYINQKADELGIMRVVLVNLKLAVDLFDLELPEKILESLNSDEVEKITFKVKETLFDPENSVNILQMAYIRLNIRERRNLKFKDLLKILFVPTNSDWKTLSLSPLLLPFSHIIRFIKVLKDY